MHHSTGDTFAHLNSTLHSLIPLSGVPSGFKVKSDGVYFESDDEKSQTIKICSPLQVVAQTVDVDGNSWGRLLEWIDPDGRLHSWAMPMSMTAGGGEEYRRLLLDGGWKLGPGRKTLGLVHMFLTESNPPNRIRCVKSTGWHNNNSVFVFPTYSLGSNNYIFQSEKKPVVMCQLGSLFDWQTQVAAKACGNSRLLLAISAAFAAPLLKLVNAESGAFHLRGNSSTGKTTAALIAVSVYGDSRFLESWKTTDNALEETAMGHNDLVLVLDEMSQVPKDKAGEIVYMLANGRGKARANKSGGLRDSSTWRLLTLSTGEVSLNHQIALSGQRTNAGQDVRMIDIPADAGAGLGLFENLHTYERAKDFADEIKNVSSRFCGTAGPAFIQMLIDHQDGLTERIEIYKSEFLKRLPDGCDGQVYRCADRFALVAAAGELATEYGITGWQKGEASAGVSVCMNDWLSVRGDIGPLEKNRFKQQLQLFFEQNGESRFTYFSQNYSQRTEELNRTDIQHKTINRAGFRRKTAIGDYEYLVLPEVLKMEIRGFDFRTALIWLKEDGILRPGSDKSSQNCKIEGANRRVYVFSSAIDTYADSQ